MKKYIFKPVSILSLGILLLAFSCKKDNPEPDSTTYTVPSTYTFENLNYNGQIIRLIMMDSLSNYMNKANQGNVVDASILKNMYANNGNPFNNTELDASGKQLKNKTFSLDQNYFDLLFDSLAVLSQSGSQLASNGVVGVKEGRLLNENGVELIQVIKKQLMGAVFYYQAMESYLLNLATDDNITIVSGEGTAQEHHTDEAFGYLGVPTDFPSNKDGLKYWGGYCDEVNPITNSNVTLMKAFIKLRAAVTNKDNTTRNAQLIIIRDEWEKVVAASAILELTEAKAAFGSDEVQMLHVTSEAIGFIQALKYNSTKKITNTQIQNAVDALGENLYELSLTKLNNSINIINGVYGFNLNLF